MALIKLENVTKKFKDTKVLENVSIELEEGKIYGFVGINGSGKSVLFKLICGLMIPSEGNIWVDGKSLTNGHFAEGVGILLDGTGFLPRASAMSNLKSIAIINNIIDDNRIRECIEMVGLDPESKKHVGKYSLGMKQRLGIAQAIMERPKILLLDEPMNGLDEDGVIEVRKLLKELNINKGVTILMASHNKEDLSELCEKVYMLKKQNLSLIEN